MELKNFYECLPKEYLSTKRQYKSFNKLRIEIPFRMIILGCSGSGKTNLLLNLITHMNAFTKYYLFCKNLDQPLYNYLIDKFERIGDEIGEQIIEYSDDLKTIPSIDEIDSEDDTLFIFDDVITEKNLKLVEELEVELETSSVFLLVKAILKYLF